MAPVSCPSVAPALPPSPAVCPHRTTEPIWHGFLIKVAGALGHSHLPNQGEKKSTQSGPWKKQHHFIQILLDCHGNLVSDSHLVNHQVDHEDVTNVELLKWTSQNWKWNERGLRDFSEKSTCHFGKKEMHLLHAVIRKTRWNWVSPFLLCFCSVSTTVLSSAGRAIGLGLLHAVWYLGKELGVQVFIRNFVFNLQPMVGKKKTSMWFVIYRYYMYIYIYEYELIPCNLWINGISY